MTFSIQSCTSRYDSAFATHQMTIEDIKKMNLKNLRDFKSAINLLHNRPLQDLEEFINHIRDQDELFVQIEFINLLIPILKKISDDQLIDILNKNKHVFFYRHFESTLKILDGKSPQVILQILSSINEVTFLSNYLCDLPDVTQLVLPLPLEDLLTLSDKNGRICLHSQKEMLSKMAPFLEKIPIDKLFKLLFFKNGYGSSLRNYDISTVRKFIHMHSQDDIENFLISDACQEDISNGKLDVKDIHLILSELSNHRLIKILSYRNSQGETLFHQFFDLPSLFIDNLQESDFYDLMTIANNEGKTPLHSFFDCLSKEEFSKNESYRSQILRILKCCPQETINFITSLNKHGSSLLYNISNFKLFLPFLDTLSSSESEEFINRIKNQGQLFYDNEFIELLTPILKKISIDQLFDILFKNEHAFFYCYFESTIKIFDGKPPQVIFQIISNINEKVTFLNNYFYKIPDVTQLVLPLPLEDLLTIQDKNGMTCLHFVTTFSKMIPFLEKMPIDKLFKFLFIKNIRGWSPYEFDCKKVSKLIRMHSYDDIENFLISKTCQEDISKGKLNAKDIHLILYGLSIDELLKMLSFKNPQGETFFHQLFDLPFYFIDKVPKSDFYHLMTIANYEGKIPLHSFFECLRKDYFSKNACIQSQILRILECCPQETINFITSLNGDGSTLLHDSSYFKLFLPFLNKLSLKELIRVLYTKNVKGKTPISNPGIRKLARPLIEKLEIFSVIEVSYDDQENPIIKKLTLDMNELKNRSLDNFTRNFEISILSRLSTNEIWEFMSHKKEELYLCKNKTFKLFKPILKKLKTNQLINLISYYELSSDDRYGILDNPKKFSLILSILMDKSPDYVEKIFTSPSWQICAYDPNYFEVMIPLLKKLPEINLIKILKKQTKFLHKYFIKVLPLIKNLPIHNFKKLMSITDDQGMTPLQFFLSSTDYLENEIIANLSHIDDQGLTILQKPHIFSMFIPFFEKLPLNLLAQVLLIKDGSGKIILKDPKLCVEASGLIEKLERKRYVIHRATNGTDKWIADITAPATKAKGI